MSKILIAGSSGILGTDLTKSLKNNNEITSISNSNPVSDIQLNLLDMNKVDGFVLERLGFGPGEITNNHFWFRLARAVFK